MQRTTLALLTPKLSATPYLQAQWQYSGGISRHYNWLTDRRRILDAMNTENTADEMLFIGAHYLFITIHDGKIFEKEDLYITYRFRDEILQGVTDDGDDEDDAS